MDQCNLHVMLQEWKTKYGSDSFFFREYSEKDASAGDESEVDDDEDEVLVTDNNCGKGLLLCHQTEWQKRLLVKYGNEISLLDATYKTSRYALPLFFICVKTNVNYCVVASFIVQYETKAAIAEALEMLKQWNTQWNPLNWMTDFSEVEINALNEVFPGTCPGYFLSTQTLGLLWRIG